jgi:DNA-binding response OmpR family regulator
MTSHRVLVADTDIATHRAVEKSLAGKGYLLASATDGQQALDTATRFKPDTVIVEPELPKLDGLALVKKLRSMPDFSMIPAIFLASREAVEPRILGFKIGADDFLPKPLNAADLDARLGVARDTSRKTEDSIRSQPPPEGGDFSVVMTGFRGSLDQIGLPSLMTLMEIERKTGTLVILLDDDRDKARLTFAEGRLLRASLDKRIQLKNAELVYELFGRTKGKFDFRPGAVVLNDEIRQPAVTLLLEGARRLDERLRR